ncbi:MAG TPA: cyclic nucleotide-binding domain-containing protein [Candidatus Cloacimonadota bacterium]|nr:cyclic nucleotide-binding domain-containing protein [Candidatus Cloacimonadota bacterium]HPT72551.1 cyclic nucleotide-binding domain-containing protein [Candidatus Cloacimonadota bacterium]
MELLDTLKRIDIFAGLSDEELTQVANRFDRLEVAANEAVISEGTPGDFFYIIISGEVTINKVIPDPDSTQAPLTVMGPNEFFGEMALIDEFPRSASAIANQDSVLIRIGKDSFIDLCTSYPKLLFNLIRTLSFRLRETNTRFIEALENIMKKNKLAAIGMAASKIIHDIRTPLTVIVLAAQIIEQLYPQAAEFSHDIIKQTDFLDQLVKEMLDYAHGKESTIYISPFDLEETMNELVLHGNQISKGKTISFEVNNKVDQKLCLDGMKVKRVLLNLLKNSVEAIPETGTVILDADIQGKYFHFRISDTGPGVPDFMLKNLFDPFFTTGKTQGTGLGLAICEKIIHDHHGNITYKNRDGGGSQFDILLPLVFERQNIE